MIQGRTLRTTLFAVALLAAAALVPVSAAAQILISETSARFDWQPADGDVEFYQVFVSRSTRDGKYELEQTILGTSSSAIIDASPGEVLRIRVRAGNDKAFGPMSQPSDTVRFGLPPEMPMVGTPGVLSGRVSGSDDGSIFYADADTGEVWSFSAEDPSQTPAQLGSENDPSWQLVASGDFDGDGAADLFWHHASGATRIWYLDAGGYEEETGPLSPGPEWQAEITSDLDGNGQDDIFWRDPVGPTLAWLRTGVDFGLVYFPPMPADSWELLAAGDYDGDGFDDLFWRDVVSTDTAIWFTVNDPYNGLYARVRDSKLRSMLWEVFESFDDDGDGFDDIHWRQRDSHDVSDWWHMDGETVRVD
jgi:hypothetical protein